MLNETFFFDFQTLCSVEILLRFNCRFTRRILKISANTVAMRAIDTVLLRNIWSCIPRKCPFVLPFVETPIWTLEWPISSPITSLPWLWPLIYLSWTENHLLFWKTDWPTIQYSNLNFYVTFFCKLNIFANKWDLHILFVVSFKSTW